MSCHVISEQTGAKQVQAMLVRYVRLSVRMTPASKEAGGLVREIRDEKEVLRVVHDQKLSSTQQCSWIVQIKPIVRTESNDQRLPEKRTARPI